MQISTNVSQIILHERVPNVRGEATGWLILSVRQTKVREILAVLTCEVGLDYARQMARMLAIKYRVDMVEELTKSDQANTNLPVLDQNNYSSPN